MTKLFKSKILILLAAVMIAPASYSGNFAHSSNNSYICKFGESNNTFPNLKFNHCDKCVALYDDDINVFVFKTSNTILISKPYKTLDSIQVISNKNIGLRQRAPPLS